LFKLDFAPATAGAISGTKSEPEILASAALAIPMLTLTVFVSIVVSMLLVFFPPAISISGARVVRGDDVDLSCFTQSWRSGFFGKLLQVVPLSGFVPGLDIFKFLLLPLVVGIVYQLGSEARLYRAMLLEEAGKDYVRTARAKG